MRIEPATCAPYGAAHCSNSEYSEVLVQEGQKWGNIAGKSRFWGRKAPTDRFPAQIFIVLPSRRPVAAIIGDIRGITRFFARNSSFSVAVAPPHIHFYRISEFERRRSPLRRLRRIGCDGLFDSIFIHIQAANALYDIKSAANVYKCISYLFLIY